MKTHIFNPQHDLALSEGTPWYRAPKSALEFASNCALIPMWYADEGDAILTPMPDPLWWGKMCERFPRLKSLTLKQELSEGDTLEPWGHDAEVYYRLGIKPQVDIARIRHLSDRKMTCKAFEWLLLNGITDLPASPAILETLESVDNFIECNRYWVLKLPLSGSGIGIMKGDRGIDTGMRNRIKTELKRNGHVMGERLLDKVLDFAMEFSLRNGICTFEGYSLFETTDKGIYAGNLLAPNDVIEGKITKYVPLQMVVAVREQLQQFFIAEYTGYSGPIGVDMMVYKDETSYRLNPVVEINVRHTMGFVARRLYDNFLHQGNEGWLRILRPNKIGSNSKGIDASITR